MDIFNELESLRRKWGVSPPMFGPAVNPIHIRRIERLIGHPLDPEIRRLYQRSDGSGIQPWGAWNDEHGIAIPVFLPSIQRMIDYWEMTSPYDESKLSQFINEHPLLDPRVNDLNTINSKWILIGYYEPMNLCFFSDGDPGPRGAAGQVLVRNDPERISWYAGNYNQFLESIFYNLSCSESNKTLLIDGPLIKDDFSQIAKQWSVPDLVEAVNAGRLLAKEAFQIALNNRNKDEIVSLGKRLAIDINERHEKNETYLIQQSYKKNSDAVAALIVLGADVDAKADGNITALMKAQWGIQDQRSQRIIEMLRKSGEA